MLSHNINAECGDNPPLFQQVYDQALKNGVEKSQGLRVPAIPYFKDAEIASAQQIEEINARKPIMPKQLRSTKKGEKKPKPSIQIAKAEMTLTGFEHTGKVLRKKARLEARALRQVEVTSNRKSSMKAASLGIVDVDTEDEDTDSQQGSHIEELPMNEDIELSEHNLQDQNQDSQDQMEHD